MRELLIGCGHRRDKIIGFDGQEDFNNLTTLDINPACGPDVVWDLEEFPYPFEDNSFDEIHAYEVLEHMGTQGDYKFFFNQFNEFYRILKPLGLFIATIPSPETCFTGDPGHKRIFGSNTFIFLQKQSYNRIGITPITDYSEYVNCDFNLVWEVKDDPRFPSNYFFALQAIK